MQQIFEQAGTQLLAWLAGFSAVGIAWLALLAALLSLAGIVFIAVLVRQRGRLRLRSLELESAVLSLQQSLLGEQKTVAAQEQQLTRLAGVEKALAAASSSRDMLSGQGEQQRAELAEARQALSQIQSDYAALEARTLAEHKAMSEQLALLQKNRQQLTGEFELLANRIFEEKTRSFTKTSKLQLDSTLSPLKNQLDDFRKRVDFVYGEEAKERKVLQEQIRALRAESLRISEDASNLTQALKADNKAQGNWGELTLVRALEVCGLREPQEYETQLVLKAEDKSRQVPDVVVHLPGGKDIIIDSKVSLVAYARYFEAESDEDRQLAMGEHLQSVRQHLRALSAKSYQDLPGIKTLDYVMMYIPVEGASAMALQADRNLWEEAYAKNIVLVSPTNLLAILRSVETIWRHEKQNKNAEEIARQAGNLHDKFVGLVSTLETVGRSLDSAQSAYDKAYSQLSSGKGNLVSRVQKLEKLGAKTRQRLPGQLRERAQREDEAHQLEGVDSSNAGADAAGSEKALDAPSGTAAVLETEGEG